MSFIESFRGEAAMHQLFPKLLGESTMGHVYSQSPPRQELIDLMVKMGNLKDVAKVTSLSVNYCREIMEGEKKAVHKPALVAILANHQVRVRKLVPRTDPEFMRALVASFPTYDEFKAEATERGLMRQGVGLPRYFFEDGKKNSATRLRWMEFARERGVPVPQEAARTRKPKSKAKLDLASELAEIKAMLRKLVDALG